MSRGKSNILLTKWIKENEFIIHEYALTRQGYQYEALEGSLKHFLRNRRKAIKIEKITRLKTWIRIEYNKKYCKILIDIPKRFRVNPII